VWRPLAPDRLQPYLPALRPPSTWFALAVILEPNVDPARCDGGAHCASWKSSRCRSSSCSCPPPGLWACSERVSRSLRQDGSRRSSSGDRGLPLGCAAHCPCGEQGDHGVRVFYVADSGNEHVSVITAVTFELERWPTILKDWIGWRPLASEDVPAACRFRAPRVGVRLRA
jgi:hypothetical protein